MIQINKDVYFGKYGDFQFGTGDVRTINTPTEIVKQNVIDRVRSSMSDYLNENPAVANLQSLIGRTDDLAIERGAEKQIKQALTIDGFLQPGDFDVVAWKDKHTLYIKLTVLIQNGTGLTEVVNINYIFNTVTGLQYGN